MTTRLSGGLPTLLLPLVLAAPGAAQQVHSLTTTFAAGNGQSGNMFDIKALTDVHVVTLDCHFNAGTPQIEVYTIPGGYSGFEALPSSWTLVGSGSTTSAGSGLPTPLPFSFDVLIPAGTTMGFYVTGTGSPGIAYTNGTGVVYSNADIELYEGLGVVYPFGGTYSPRTWNGTVYYTSDVGQAYCFGDGTAAPCPCINSGGSEEGCANSTGVGAKLISSGSTSVLADDLLYVASGLVPGQPALLFAGSNQLGGGQGTSFGDVLRCTGGGVMRLSTQLANATGDATFPTGLAATLGAAAGDVRNFQVWYSDPVGSSCGSGFNLSHGVSVTYAP